jgi:hypothetical protein
LNQTTPRISARSGHVVLSEDWPLSGSETSLTAFRR